MGQGTWSWIVPDGLWEIAKPLIPPSKVRPQGGGTQDTPDETLFAGAAVGRLPKGGHVPSAAGADGVGASGSCQVSGSNVDMAVRSGARPSDGPGALGVEPSGGRFARAGRGPAGLCSGRTAGCPRSRWSASSAGTSASARGAVGRRVGREAANIDARGAGVAGQLQCDPGPASPPKALSRDGKESRRHQAVERQLHLGSRGTCRGRGRRLGGHEGAEPRYKVLKPRVARRCPIAGGGVTASADLDEPDDRLTGFRRW